MKKKKKNKKKKIERKLLMFQTLSKIWVYFIFLNFELKQFFKKKKKIEKEIEKKIEKEKIEKEKKKRFLLLPNFCFDAFLKI